MVGLDPIAGRPRSRHPRPRRVDRPRAAGHTARRGDPAFRAGAARRERAERAAPARRRPSGLRCRDPRLPWRRDAPDVPDGRERAPAELPRTKPPPGVAVAGAGPDLRAVSYT